METGSACRLLVDIPIGKRPLGGVVGRILQSILNKWDGNVWTAYGSG
jgi:hypothetical protein